MIAEKGLKAIIADKTNEIPPKIHDLMKLAVLGGIYSSLTEEQLSFLEELMPFQIEARYSSTESSKVFSTAYCIQLLDETEEFLCWIRCQLEN